MEKVVATVCTVATVAAVGFWLYRNKTKPDLAPPVTPTTSQTLPQTPENVTSRNRPRTYERAHNNRTTLAMLQDELYNGLRKIQFNTTNHLEHVKNRIRANVTLQGDTDNFESLESLDELLTYMKNTQTLAAGTLIVVAAAIKDMVDQAEMKADIPQLLKEIALFDFESDILLLHSEVDRDDAIDFVRHFKDTCLVQLVVNIRLYEEISTGGTVFQDMSDVFNSFRLVCVLVTENLTRDRFTRYIKDMCLMETLTDDIARERLVPVWKVESRKSKVVELSPIPGLRYHYFIQDNNDETYMSSVKNMINRARSTIRKSDDIAG